MEENKKEKPKSLSIQEEEKKGDSASIHKPAIVVAKKDSAAEESKEPKDKLLKEKRQNERSPSQENYFGSDI